ncbi:MAG TPA: PLP-dependent aminotransferase family protein [Jatrophihabitans sp.]|nr:PLP-dependent aminotransferase family protein [Jatrophihabitans sp.]
MSTTRTDDELQLRAEELHHSIADPALSGITLLNEIAARYPAAISFAPGWPPDEDYRGADVGRYLQIFAEHACGRGPDSDAAAGRLLFQYGPTAGIVRDLVARWLAEEQNIVVDPAAVVMTVGCQEALAITVRTLFAEKNDVLLVQAPSYFGILGVARILDVDLLPVPEGPDGLTAEAVRQAAAQLRREGRRARALYVIPSYANPSGHSMDLATRQALLDLAYEQGLVLIEDNAYGSFTRTGAQPPTLKSLDRARVVVHVGSFSKIAAPGLRVGFIIADQRIAGAVPGAAPGMLAGELAKVKSVLSVNTSPICQAILGGMLIEAQFRLTQHAQARISAAAERLTAMLDALDRLLGPLRMRFPELSWSRPGGGFFVQLNVPFTADLAALTDSAQNFGVLWCPMSLFRPDGGGIRQIRLASSYASPDDVERGIARLAGFIEHRAALASR